MSSASAIIILLQKLSTGEETALKAAEALQRQAKRSPEIVSGHIDKLYNAITSSEMNVRAAVASIFGAIGSDKAVDLLFRTLSTEPEHILSTECSFSCWSAEPFYYWIINSIKKPESKKSAKCLIQIIGSANFSLEIRACAMEALSYFIDDVDVPIPKEVAAFVISIAESDDNENSAKAIELLGYL